MKEPLSRQLRKAPLTKTIPIALGMGYSIRKIHAGAAVNGYTRAAVNTVLRRLGHRQRAARPVKRA